MATATDELVLSDPQARQAAHPVLNRDREEIQVHSPHGPHLLAFLARRGIRGSVRTEPYADVITLLGEPDMGRVYSLIVDWTHGAGAPRG
jgi:hypothetical protein